MKVWKDITGFTAGNPVVSIGVFDGVHRGHHFLIEEMKTKAKEINGESVALTLWPHPRIILNKDPDKLRYLTSLDEKILLLDKTGIDHLVIIPFTDEFSRLDSCEFVEEYLVKGMNLSHLLLGYNHKFGKNREGDFDRLRECACQFDFGLTKLEQVNLNGEKLSSSIIRELLITGDLDKANKFLGYTYFLKGYVMDGKGLGRQLGFPTANIAPSDLHKLIPSDGVYAVEVEFGSGLYKGMMNIGHRPTLKNDVNQKSIEVNIFNFEGDLYGKDITVYFRKRLRDEKKFDNLEQLKAQLVIDKSQALGLLGGL
jgi:riboflavin kinase/FMN adenylyltransferase